MNPSKASPRDGPGSAIYGSLLAFDYCLLSVMTLCLDLTPLSSFSLIRPSKTEPKEAFDFCVDLYGDTSLDLYFSIVASKVLKLSLLAFCQNFCISSRLASLCSDFLSRPLFF